MGEGGGRGGRDGGRGEGGGGEGGGGEGDEENVRIDKPIIDRDISLGMYGEGPDIS